MDSREAFLSGAAIRWRARKGVEKQLQQIRDMHSESFASQCGSIVEGQPGLHSQQSEMEEIGNEMMIEEDIVVGTSHFDQQSFRMDLPEEESESDQDADETDQACNLGESLRNWALTFGVSLVALTALLGLLRLHHPDLPKDARTLLKTKVTYNIEKKCEGLYYYIGILSSFKEKLHQAFESFENGCTFKLQINIDGLPLFKSSGIQVWPILGCLLGFPIKEPVVIALFCGPQKPKPAEVFLEDFVSELKKLESGIDFEGKMIFVKLDSVIRDTPARAFVKNIKSHNGYFGCDKCAQQGEYLSSRMTFPLDSCPLRTDESFAQKQNEEHHQGPNPFQGLNVGMVSQFPGDYMHSVCLGVVRKLLNIWLRGALKFRLPSSTVNRMSDCLTGLRSYIPLEFARKPRTLRDLDRWKATEFRMFLLYIGPVILPSYLDKNIYQNCMLLFSSIAILGTYADTLLRMFVTHFGQLYGKEALVYNVHSLVHLAQDVRQHGCLDNISAFPYENHLQKLKKLVRKPERPLPQMLRRLSEQNQIMKLSINKSVSLKKAHFVGPVPNELASRGVKGQYSEMVGDQWTIKISTGDNTFVINGDICRVYNVVDCTDATYIVYKRFCNKSVFFTYPFSSDFLNIFSVSLLSEHYVFAKVCAVAHKCVLLPHRGGFVAIPIQHLVRH
ncbi:hypothetical protein N1851_002949 [Merluccius polli]|uniref:Transposase domain-containing protein n=1 Tax=Merluccius polli TaxID=89951 RepID=A0AA47NAM7_MERPO|nr:hypothetical protein N1851_002949 [Merluccius polli]